MNSVTYVCDIDYSLHFPLSSNTAVSAVFFFAIYTDLYQLFLTIFPLKKAYF